MDCDAAAAVDDDRVPDHENLTDWPVLIADADSYCFDLDDQRDCNDEGVCDACEREEGDYDDRDDCAHCHLCGQGSDDAIGDDYFGGVNGDDGEQNYCDCV